MLTKTLYAMYPKQKGFNIFTVWRAWRTWELFKNHKATIHIQATIFNRFKGAI